ncbi:winged helix-turn-helix domain-containing protein [Candidatus Viadribacter manganicus]|uniref:OmpR/PhoB-type domain-containing protein n=1 Tax=Candidatus Viadribacter manganicus TaxID=1759059 RepID=A0A1B1AJP1_9PROT|nr:winged helix-turn-helix domain-containing protein [Candidatus Viadribacter manganicus]ANP46789.1 hypothetical protein ATE48_13150 [Candidatus Viadribacter manganicus]
MSAAPVRAGKSPSGTTFGARVSRLWVRTPARRLTTQALTIEAPAAIDFDNGRVCVDGYEVRASPCEAKLLRVFLEHAGQGGEEDIDAQFVRVLVGDLRQKIEKDPARPSLIVTETGVGYRPNAGD